MYVGIQKQHVLHLKYIQFLFCYFKKNIVTGLSWWLSRKDFCLQCRRRSFDPWVGKFRQGRKWQTLSSILALEIPWTEESGRLRSTGSKSIGHNLATKQQPCLEPLPWFLLQFYLLLPLLQNKVKMTSNMLVLWWKECCLQGNSEVHCFKHRLLLGPQHLLCSETLPASISCTCPFSLPLHNFTTALSHLKYFHLFFHLPSYPSSSIVLFTLVLDLYF